MQDLSLDALVAIATASNLHELERGVGGLRSQGKKDIGLSGMLIPISFGLGHAALSRHFACTGAVDVISKTGLYDWLHQFWDFVS
jgi:hypothetical protein